MRQETFSTTNSKELKFEDKRKNFLNEVFNLKNHKEQQTWKNIELWMIKFKPSLYEIVTRDSSNKNLQINVKFTSLINKVCYLLLSGLVKFNQTKRSI